MLQLSSLKELSDRLRKQLSREKSSRVKSKLKALQQRRERIKELSVKRREELELSRLLCIFNRDVAEVTTVPNYMRASICSISLINYLTIFICTNIMTLHTGTGANREDKPKTNYI